MRSLSDSLLLLIQFLKNFQTERDFVRNLERSCTRYSRVSEKSQIYGQDCPQKCSINIGIIMNFEELHIEQRYSKKKNVYFNFSIRDDFIVCNRDNFNIKIGGEGESAGNPISYLDRLPSKA